MFIIQFTANMSIKIKYAWVGQSIDFLWLIVGIFLLKWLLYFS